MSFRDFLKEQTINEDLIDDEAVEYNQNYDYGIQDPDTMYVKAYCPTTDEAVRLSGDLASLTNDLMDYIEKGYKIVKCTEGWEEELGDWKSDVIDTLTESANTDKISKDQLSIIDSRSEQVSKDFKDEVIRLINSGGVAKDKFDDYPLTTIFKVVFENLADKWSYGLDTKVYKNLKKF